MSKTKKAAKTPNTEKAKAPRYELFGQPVTAVLRWMGANGFKPAAAFQAVTALGAPCSKGTVAQQVIGGRKGQRGEPAKLTKAQAKELKAAAEEEPAAE